MTLIGEGGVLNQTQTAKIKNVHANVYEQIQLEAAAYSTEKLAEGTESTQNGLLSYLRTKGFIDENNVINVTNLVGNTLETGKGSIEDGDVYVLEEIEEATQGVEYNVVYYGKTEVDNAILGKLTDARGLKTAKATREDFFEITNDGTIYITENTSKDPNGIGYYYDENYGRIISESNVIIPAEINGVQVKEIGNSAFGYAYNLKSIVIPEGVEYLNRHAFQYCTELSEIYFPASLEVMDYESFNGCNKITTINYGGTMEEWNNIRIYGNYYGAPRVSWEKIFGDDAKVYCTDGIITT